MCKRTAECQAQTAIYVGQVTNKPLLAHCAMLLQSALDGGIDGWTYEVKSTIEEINEVCR